LGYTKGHLTPKSLSEHYFEQSLCLPNYLFIKIVEFLRHSQFFLKMFMVICVLDDFNMFLSVLKHGSKTVSH
jgi:hypothetical protein